MPMPSASGSRPRRRGCSPCWVSTPIRSAAASTFFFPTCLMRPGAAAGTSICTQLIQHIQRPPFDRVGVVDLESFFPAAERYKLAMSLNNLLASPSFASWLEGEPLDVHGCFTRPSGKPRLAIVSIAHLDERAADVLRHAAAQRSAVLGSHAAGNEQPARAPVYGRSVRLLPAARPIRPRSGRCSRC